MNEILENYQHIRSSLRRDCIVLPVSKGQSVEKIQNLLSCVNDFGENYFEELLLKSRHFKDVKINWHFLGRLQSRKIDELLRVTSHLHGLCRAKELEMIAKSLDQIKSPQFKGFYIQVNISDEDSKGGVHFTEVPQLLEEVKSLKLEKYFLGFMGMATPLDNYNSDQIREEFRTLRALRDNFAPGKTLNMGMSDDYPIAVEEGSNLIRIGSKIFGARE